MRFVEQLEDNDEVNKRKKQITLIAESYYNRFKFLHSESCESFVKKIYDLFLNSDLTINQINEEILKIVKIRKNEFEKQENKLNLIDKEKAEEANKIVEEKEAIAKLEMTNQLAFGNSGFTIKSLLVGIILLFLLVIFIIIVFLIK